MSVQNYVLSKYISGITKADIQLDIWPLKENDSYSLSNPLATIAEDMFADLENVIDVAYTEDTIHELLIRGGKFRLKVFDSGTASDKLSVIIVANASTQTYLYDVKGTAIRRKIYEIQSIDTSDLKFLVSEHILLPEEGVPLVERCYHPVFDDLFRAERYQSLKMENYKLQHGLKTSGFRIFPVSFKEISQSKWYKDNLYAASQIKGYGLDSEYFRYFGDTEELLSQVRARSYDNLPVAEQAAINKEIYDKLRELVSEDDLPFLDEELKTLSLDNIEPFVDAVIIMSVANAKTEEDFNKVEECLGVYDYRLGSITDDIYNAHPDEGHILITKNGELKWYADCFYIGKWEGAKDNPYFGKFQPNENDTLLCLREFHPDLFVNSLPSDDEIARWKHQYLNAMADVKNQHNEMFFDEDLEGNLVAVGTWYYAGVFHEQKYDNVEFQRTYNTYTFNQEECKKLLSGEEITVEHYVTQLGMETTMKGKLFDCSGMYDSEMRVSFVRTDVNVSEQRKYIDAELGIEESNLPVIPH